MTPNEYCQKIAVKSGSSFYYSFLFLPAEQRLAITALYAFCREVDDIVDKISEKSVAQIKLAWWKDEINRLFDGNPQHPVSQALAPHIHPMQWQKQWFMDIIQGMYLDLDYHGYATFEDLEIYCYHAAGAVGILSSHIFGGRETVHHKYAKALGTALQLVNIIRDVGEDVQKGRIYLPETSLQQFGITPQDILDKKDSPKFRALLAYEAKRAREFYAKAQELLPENERMMHISALIMGKVYFSLLDEIEAEDFNVLNQRISLTPIRKFYLAWQLKRHEKKQAKLRASQQTCPV